MRSCIAKTLNNAAVAITDDPDSSFVSKHPSVLPGMLTSLDMTGSSHEKLKSSQHCSTQQVDQYIHKPLKVANGSFKNVQHCNWMMRSTFHRRGNIVHDLNIYRKPAFLLSSSCLAVGASAAILPRDQCCFQITAAGGKSGVVGQLGDGQNRIGGGYPTGTYCLNNGGITDAQGRGCILTPPTTQFQCDVGAAPTSGFSVSSSGQVLYNGSNKFYACGAAPDIYNIYTVPVEGQKDCVEITLSTGGKCIPSGGAPPASPSSPAPSSPAPPSTPSYQAPPSPPASSSVPSYSHPAGSQPPVKSTVTRVSTIPVQTPPKQSTPAPSASKPVTPSGSACPTALTGPYQTPHLIVPVSSSQPDKAYGTQYNATISPSECTIFNFDIPQSYNSKSCSIIFLFPQQSQLQTSSFTFSGSGDLTFSELSGVANVQTTYNNAPSKKKDLGSVHPQPGNSYAISTESCAAGSTQSIEVCGANGLSLSFFQDYNPSPIGVFVTSC